MKLFHLFTCLISILFISCDSPYEVFRIKNNEDTKLISLDTIENVEAFNESYWEEEKQLKNLKFIVPFNFEEAQLDNSSLFGVSLMALPYRCFIDVHYKQRSISKIYYNHKGQMMNGDAELMTAPTLTSYITQNILNHGKNPELSDDPSEAIIGIYLNEDFQLKNLDAILAQISKSYLDLINKQAKLEDQSVQELSAKYPLNIMLRSNISIIEPPNVSIEDIDDEIESEIEIDIGIDSE